MIFRSMSVVPGVAAVIDVVVEGFENSVRQPVLPHELPDVFSAVEFGCARRELQGRDVVWNLEGLSAMPPGLIGGLRRTNTTKKRVS